MRTAILISALLGLAAAVPRPEPDTDTDNSLDWEEIDACL